MVVLGAKGRADMHVCGVRYTTPQAIPSKNISLPTPLSYIKFFFLKNKNPPFYLKDLFSKMPSEEEQKRQAAEEAAAEAEAAQKKAEEDQKTKAEITKALTDETITRQLSSTGDAARARRGY